MLKNYKNSKALSIFAHIEKQQQRLLLRVLNLRIQQNICKLFVETIAIKTIVVAIYFNKTTLLEN